MTNLTRRVFLKNSVAISAIPVGLSVLTTVREKDDNEYRVWLDTHTNEIYAEEKATNKKWLVK